ncbi:forespore capture DNA-binding protein RefZ [Bacillus sp. FJAT-47783]|uniref:forespore capture DNA-binding protein RefZ n=1 Tax=Bacillus sp. FJAT-47783 TaxID=2922712 RepID=UPI001FAD8813|nr:forespore capture DNA-binding protein RefZ [Bacillus sp. FJAT-47783]
MPSNSSLTKEKIVDAAIALFNTKGYSGTSVREIAEKANVNVAHISYYFKGKGGLLEYLVSQFYEGYLLIISTDHPHIASGSAKDVLNQMIWDILKYQQKHRQLTRFVYRELTLDTVLIREVMTTYLAKEKYFIRNILEKGITDGEFHHVSISYMILQLKSLLNMPFLQSHYLSEVLHVHVHEEYFIKHYYHDILSWLENFLYKKTVEKVAL